MFDEVARNARCCGKASEQVTRYGVASRNFARPQAHVHNQMHVLAHNCPSVNAAGKNVAQFQNAGFNPGFSVLVAFAVVFVQPRTAKTGEHSG